MGTTIADMDIEIKTKISRIKYFESKTNSQLLQEFVNLLC